MDGKFILAIDQGTTNTKAILVDQQGEIIASATCTLAIYYPQPAWVEQDGAEIWRTVQTAIEKCLQGQSLSRLSAIAVTNQRETVILWDRRTGIPLGPCIVWQCHRTAPFCEELKANGLETIIRERTGLTIDPMFSASKMRWLLDHAKNGYRRAEAGELCLGTIDSWVVWNLTGGAIHVCDFTNASRTQLLNLRDLSWDPELLRIFGIPQVSLPEIHSSNKVVGETIPVGSLPAGIPIASLIGDSHAALFGHAGFQPGAVKATYGTGSSLMTPTKVPVLSQRGLSTTIAWGRKPVTYALEGNIYSTGATVQWLSQVLGLQDSGKSVEELASQVDESDGVYLVPAFVGLGAPHWNEAARGLITGLTRGTTAAHLARAAIESIAYQVRDVFDVMSEEAGVPLQFLLADGGASRNNHLMQFQADILDRPVIRNLSADVSALGAAYMAGLTIGAWLSEDEIQNLPRPTERFEPRQSANKRLRLYSGWQAAIRRATFDTMFKEKIVDGAGHDA
jgi:glycerol kinase